MAKKRKTRQEKVIADLRRKLVTQIAPDPIAPTSSVSTYMLPSVKPVVSNTSHLKPNTYAYVLSDLRKTLILTSIAIASQVALYLIMAK